MIDKILLAVDGSPNAQRATDIAGELAAKLKAELHIVHVLMHGRPSAELVRMAEVEHIVKQAHDLVSPGLEYVAGSYPDLLGGTTDDTSTQRIITVLGEQIVGNAKLRCQDQGAQTVKTSVVSGDVAKEILNAANEFGVEMIVVGSRGLGTIKSTILGSVSQHVLHHAECSVVTVR